MYYVYLIDCRGTPARRYVGSTEDLDARVADHNAGRSPHTAKFGPWRLVACIAFSTRPRAEQFERYIKSGSGHAFAKKRLW